MPDKIEFKVHQDLKNYWFNFNYPNIQKNEIVENANLEDLDLKLKSDRSQTKGIV